MIILEVIIIIFFTSPKLVESKDLNFTEKKTGQAKKVEFRINLYCRSILFPLISDFPAF